MFDRESADGLTTATREEISDSLPVVVAQGPVKVLLPGPTGDAWVITVVCGRGARRAGTASPCWRRSWPRWAWR